MTEREPAEPIEQEPTEQAEAESTRAPVELRVQFWILVGVFKVAILGTAFGVLVLIFWSRPALGSALLAVGVAAFVLGWRRYRTVAALLDT